MTYELAKNTVYVCDKGHRFSGRTSLMVHEETGGELVDAMPYAGDYCTVCYFAWVAANVSRCRPIEESVP